MTTPMNPWSLVLRPEKGMRNFLEVEAAKDSAFWSFWRMWILLGMWAIGGSLIYGSSLAVVYPDVGIAKLAVVLTLATGMSWCLFGPWLIWVSGTRMLVCAHACLVTMAQGIIVLMLAALMNLILWALEVEASTVLLLMNVFLVACSNVLMGHSLAAQLKVADVSRLKVFLSWYIVLNGLGVVLFQFFYGWITNGPLAALEEVKNAFLG